MARDYILKRTPKIFLFIVFLALCINLVSCSPSPNLPESAREALVAHWQSLPSTAGIEHHIVRAWPGDTSAAELTPSTPAMEVWCVEAEMSSAEDISVEGERLIWIIIRENKNAPWTAALLATMSSIWPYQACGVGP